MTNNPKPGDMIRAAKAGNALTVPANVWPRENGPGFSLGFFCHHCENWHTHGWPHTQPPATGALVNRGAHCAESSGSIHARHGYNLLIGNMIRAPEDRDYRAEGARKVDPLYRRLFHLWPSLRRIVLHALFGEPVSCDLVKHIWSLGIEISIRDLTSWRIGHYARGGAWHDRRNVESAGKSLLDLLAALSGLSVGAVAVLIIHEMTPDLPPDDAERIVAIINDWAARGMPERPTLADSVSLRPRISSWVRANPIGIPNAAYQSVETVVGALMGRVAEIFATECLTPGWSCPDAETMADSVCLIWALPPELVWVRFLEAITGAVLDRAAVVALLDGPDSAFRFWSLPKPPPGGLPPMAAAMTALDEVTA